MAKESVEKGEVNHLTSPSLFIQLSSISYATLLTINRLKWVLFREVESWKISAVQGGITFSVYVMNVYELSDEAVSGMGITVNI